MRVQGTDKVPTKKGHVQVCIALTYKYGNVYKHEHTHTYTHLHTHANTHTHVTTYMRTCTHTELHMDGQAHRYLNDGMMA